MIAFLRGRLLEKQPTRIILDVQGVGYELHVPLSTFYGMVEPGQELTVRVHTHVREDALSLFGFATLMELQIFERLISVSGIGPKLALAVLSGIEPQDLVTAVQRNDIARLTAIPGIGRKTAERIGLELKDRLPVSSIDVAAGVPSPGTAPDLRSDVLSALLNLGYHRPLAERAVDGVLKAGPPSTFEAALKQALRTLAR